MKKEIREKIDCCNRIVIGLSGGADSVAMTHILLSEFGVEKLLCVHINHCIRGEEALRDENFVKDFCASFKIPLKVYTLDVPLIAKQQGLGVELCARNLRYECFNECCKENDLIATAHNLEDNAETMLLNYKTYFRCFKARN